MPSQLSRSSANALAINSLNRKDTMQNVSSRLNAGLPSNINA